MSDKPFGTSLVSDETLRDFIEGYPVGSSTHDMAMELMQRRAPSSDAVDAGRDAGRWVPWKVGDALPADGLYWTTYKTREFKVTMTGAHKTLAFELGNVIAYWSQPLPPPFSPPSPSTETKP